MDDDNRPPLIHTIANVSSSIRRFNTCEVISQDKVPETDITGEA